MSRKSIIFECDAVRRSGIVDNFVTCCSACHEGYDEAPFIVVEHERHTVCCAVASAYNIERERRHD